MKIHFTLLMICLPLISFCQLSSTEKYDLVIKKAKVIDGTGEEEFFANILIINDIIAEVQRDTSKSPEGEKVIDAGGFTVTPGFIDTHSHGDPLETPEFRNFLAMGITTITLGQDGFSPEVNDLTTWFNKVDAVRPAVNIAIFAGHNTLRKLSGINYETKPLIKKREVQQQLLREAIRAGAFGMTTGLEYSPGDFSGHQELQELAEVVGKENGIIMSHLRNEDDNEVESSLRELLAQGEFCPVHVSHLKVVYGKGEQRAKEILNLLDSARAEGIKVTADVYPYTASHTGIAILFPDWAKEPNNFKEVVSKRREELENYLREKVVQRNGPESTLIGSGTYTGKTLADLVEDLEKPFEKILIEDIGPYGAGAAHFIMDEELQKILLLDRHINVCTDGSPGMHHPRGYGSFSRIIEKYVVEEDALSLEEAVYKMSGLPADVLQIRDRGRIKEGYKADILIFRPEDIQEIATYENPKQLSKGMKYVIVNGKIALQEEEFEENGYGKTIKKQ